MRYSEMWPKYAKWWDSMKIKPARSTEFIRIAEFAVNHKAIYQSISLRSNAVPWELIAVIHRRESDADFHTYLGNGESLARKTRLVPKSRGPFKKPDVSWEDAFLLGAIDALRIDGLSSQRDWNIEKELFFCEQFNGWGYVLYHHVPSPYVWGGTNIQSRGKYVKDGKWDSNVWDPQPGCAPILYEISKLDETVKFTRET